MASMANLRVILVVVIFFSIGFGLYTLAHAETPTYFDTSISGKTYSQQDMDPNKYMSWNVTNAVWINASNWNIDYDINGWSYTKWRYVQMDNGTYCLWVETYDSGWFGYGYYNEEDLLWLNYTDNTEDWSFRSMLTPSTYGEHWVMPVTMLDYIYGWHGVYGPFLTDLDYLHFTMSNSKGTFEISMSFNTTAYSVPSLALAAEGIRMSIHQDFSDRKTSINLLNFIFGLFTFSAPGMPYPLNLIVSGFWIGCVASLGYVILTIIRSFIPMLGGGD